MKIALVCDDLIQFGGQERLVMALSEVWPDAPIYTSVISDKWQEICDEKGIKVVTSFAQKFPLAKKLYRYYAPFFVQILAFESFDFSDFDVVLSVSSRYAHAVITNPKTKHICYMNTPGRMFWESSDYFEEERYGFLRPIKFLAKPFLSLPLSLSRAWDFTSSKRVDYFVANSLNSSKRISRYYERKSLVIYPFSDFPDGDSGEVSDEGYFVVITRLASWKRVDIAVKACTKLGLKLKVIGEGPDRKRLESFAGPNIEFLGYISENDKEMILRNCSALIQTQYEDFGIVPVEAMSLGKPVIAFGRGGVLETVVENKTGLFFKEQTEASLSKVLRDFDPKDFNPQLCVTQAKKFSKQNFKRGVQGFVNDVYLKRSAAL